MGIEREKQVAAEAAAELVENGMTVGLGTGSTVAYLLPALAKRSLRIVCAATSPRTEHAARELGDQLFTLPNKLKLKSAAATIAIVGPTVVNLNTNAFRRNPAATEIRLAATARRKKFDIRLVICRAVADGMMINALASSAPIKRSPTSTVRLKRSRK